MDAQAQQIAGLQAALQQKQQMVELYARAVLALLAEIKAEDPDLLMVDGHVALPTEKLDSALESMKLGVVVRTLKDQEDDDAEPIDVAIFATEPRTGGNGNVVVPSRPGLEFGK